MAQHYKIKAIRTGRVVPTGYGDQQSYAMQLEGMGTPVRLLKACPVVEEPKVGDSLYGSVVSRYNADGQEFQEFQVAKARTATTDERIKALASVKLAVQLHIAGVGGSSDPSNIRASYNNIESEAKHLYAMVDRVIGD